MAFGGLWESWTRPDGALLRTACIMTTAANAVMEPIHDRMPVILSPDDWRLWLEGSVEEVQSLVTTYPEAGMQAWPVSRRVSRTVGDDAGMLDAVESGE